MKKIFYSSVILAVLVGVNLQAEIVNLPEVPGTCPSEEISFLTGISTHTMMDGKATVNEGWDSDKYMFTPGSAGIVKLSYKAESPISVKIDYVCGGSGLYRKADAAALKEGSIEIPVTQEQSIHIGTWDWQSNDGYPYDLNIEFIPQDEENNGADNTDNNDTDSDGDGTNGTNDTNNTLADMIVYEDAEDGNIDGWGNISSFAGTITNIALDNTRVIQLSGTTSADKNRAFYNFGGNWNNSRDFIAKWDMQADTDYEIFFIAKSSDDANIVNYIGYVNTIPTLNGYTFNPATGYWVEDATNTTLRDWGRYIYTPLEDTRQMGTIIRDLKEDALNVLGVDLTSVEGMWVNVYGDSTKSVILDNITLQENMPVVQNHIPVAEDQNITVNEGESVSIVLSGSDADNDTLTYELIDEPTLGTLSGTLPNITYVANDVEANTTDTFSYYVSDGELNSSVAIVSIRVNAVDTPDENNETNTTNIVNIDENTSIDFNCAGQMIDTPDINQTVKIQGALSGQWDSDRYSFVLPENSIASLKAVAKDADGNLLQVQVIRNCFRPLPNNDTGYLVGGEDCHLVTVVVYGCAKGEDISYTLTLQLEG